MLKRVHHSSQAGRISVALETDSLAKSLKKGEDIVKVVETVTNPQHYF